MTPDERLDKLTERVDALTQSVELLAALHRDNEARLDQLAHDVAAGFQMLGGTLQLLGASISKISTLLESHEDRIRRLEGRQ